MEVLLDVLGIRLLLEYLQDLVCYYSNKNYLIMYTIACAYVVYYYVHVMIVYDDEDNILLFSIIS